MFARVPCAGGPGSAQGNRLIPGGDRLPVSADEGGGIGGSGGPAAGGAQPGDAGVENAHAGDDEKSSNGGTTSGSPNPDAGRCARPRQVR